MKNIIFILLVNISFQINAQIDSSIKTNKKSSNEILELIDKGMSFLSERDYNKTDSIINLVSPHIDSLSSSLVLFDFNKLKADIYFDRHQMNEAIKAYEICLQESRKLKDTAKLILAYSGLGNAKVFNRRSKEALLYFEEIISILEDTKPLKYYQLKSNAAMAYNQIGQVDKSLEYYLEVKDYFNENEDDEGLAVIENNIGELYRESLQNFEMAKKHFRWAIEINLKTGNNFRLSQVYHNLSLLFGHEKVYDSAFYYLEKSKSLKETMGDIGGLAISHNALGSFYSETGNYVKAIESFDETIRISEEFGIAPGLFYGNLGKASTYDLIGSKREALIFYLRAKEVADNLQDLEMRRVINEKVFDFYKVNQNFEEALEIYEELNSVKDSIGAIEKSESLAKVRTRYETGIAEQENVRLREKELTQQKLINQQRNFLLMLIGALLVFIVMALVLYSSYKQRNRAYETLRLTSKELEVQYETVKKQEAELQIRNNLKDKIFSVLGHDLRSPLLNIIGLIDSISNIDLSKKEFQHILDHLKSETNTTLKNLQNILQWSQLQINDNPITKKIIDEDKIIQETINSYQSMANAKEIKLSYVNLKRNPFEADENQFKSIVTNLVANAIKFSPAHGEVSVKFIEESLQFVLEVKDNGSGIDPLIVHNLDSGNQIVSGKGTSGEIGTGIGLTIVRDFVKMHNGQLEFLSNYPSGTIVKVCFPKDE